MSTKTIVPPVPTEAPRALTATDVVQKIAERMSSLRAARRLSLQNVADSAGLTKSHIWELEQGRTSNPTVATVVALARAFGVSIDYLTGLASDEPALHPEALRIACDVDRLLRKNAAPAPTLVLGETHTPDCAWWENRMTLQRRCTCVAGPITSADLIRNCGGDPDAPFKPGPFPPEMREASPHLTRPATEDEAQRGLNDIWPDEPDDGVT